MSLTIAGVTTLICMLPILLRSESIDCIGSDACRNNQSITCLEENTCVINCMGESTCRHAIIRCKDNQPCYINSNDTNVLRSSTIHCPDNEDCIMNGTQANSGYRDAMINCGINGSCYFLFNHYIAGVLNFHLFTMNATYSKYVKIYKYGSAGSGTTYNTQSNISCPINNYFDGGSSRSTCDIICGGTESACDYMNIFAVSGFSNDDVNITTTLDNNFDNSYMRCTDDYSSSCSINKTNPARCVNVDSICNNYLLENNTTTYDPTNFPSNSPLTNPTSSPSESPLTSPTNSPSASPLTMPSNAPSHSPSGSPLTAPSNSPTSSPSASPLTVPSNAPSSSPSGFPQTAPTSSPSASPQTMPSNAPTSSPSGSPQTAPTNSPSNSPSYSPQTMPSNGPSSSPSYLPLTQPTRSPTISPSMAPSSPPTGLPTSTPSNSPIMFETRYPSVFPSQMPLTSTSSVTVDPTIVPSNAPREVSTTSTSSISTLAASSSGNSDNYHIIHLSNNALIAILVAIGVLVFFLIMCMNVMVVIWHKNKWKKENEDIFHEIEFGRKKNNKSKYNMHSNNNDTDDGNTIITKQSIGTAGSHGENLNEDHYHEQSLVLDPSIEILFKDLINAEDNNNNNNNNLNDNVNNNDKVARSPSTKYAKLVRYDSNDLEQVYVSRDKGTADTHDDHDDHGNDGGVALGDVNKYKSSNYQEWTQKDVILWIKEILIKNNFSNQVIVLFLKEFGKYNVTGITLEKFKHDNRFFDAFIQKFCKENQKFSIWSIIKQSVDYIGQSV